MNRSPHPPTRILRAYTEALTGFSHAHLPDGLHTTLLSQGCILGAAASVGRASAMHNPRMGSWWGASDGPGPADRSTSGHVLLTTSSNMVRPVDSTCELILHFHRFKIMPAAKGSVMQSYSNEQDVSKGTESGVGRCTADREAKKSHLECVYSWRDRPLRPL